jgi:HSP20 family molecular chaperone IbpA
MTLSCYSSSRLEPVGGSYHAGVLKLELKKKPEAQPKRIQISVAA